MSKTTTEQAKLKRLGNAIEAVFPVPGGATIKQDRGLKHLKNSCISPFLLCKQPSIKPFSLLIPIF